MALIGKPAHEGDVGEGEIRGHEEPLGPTDPDPAHILADRAPEMTVKLTAHLDGMPPRTAGEVREAQASRLVFVQEIPDAKEPRRSPSPSGGLPVGRVE